MCYKKMHDGSLLDLPPVLFGKLGNDPKKKTVMLYGHLDVQPALKVKDILIIGIFWKKMFSLFV